MFSDIKENPVLSILAAIGAGLATLNAFNTSIGLPPFWADVVISILLAILLTSWVVAAWRGPKRRAAAGMIRDPHHPRRPIGETITAVIVGAALLALLIRNGTMPLTHLVRPRWQICGTFLKSCGGTGCLKLLDARGRTVIDCAAFADVTGFIEIQQPSMTSYRPQTAAIECDGKSHPATLEPSLFQSECEGIVR